MNSNFTAAIVLATLTASVSALTSVPALASTEPAPRVAQISHGLARLEGAYEADGAPGIFVQIVDLQTGHSRLDVVTGPLEEQSGFDGAPWLRHDGILLPIDMAGAVADARARAFLMRMGWRDPSMRPFIRQVGPSSPSSGPAKMLVVRVPGASPITLSFDRNGREVERAVIDADAGPLEIRFADWRTVGTATFPFRREERDATGQKTVFIARSGTIQRGNPIALSRPAQRPHGALATPSRPVPFVLDHGDRGHIVVPALLNGRLARLVFDTGAANYFTPAVARSYGLSVGGGVNIGGVGTSSFVGGYTKADEIAIGPASLHDSVAMVAPLPAAATNPRPGLVIQGLTGFEFLSEFRTTIDYGQRTIEFTSFAQPLPAGAVLPFRTDGNSIFVEATVGGLCGWFRIDTGDGGSITLFKHFAEIAGLAAAGKRRSATGEAGGSLAYRDTVIPRFVFAGVAMSDVRAQEADQDAGAFGSRTIAGNIGAKILSQFRIVIDFQAKQLLFTPSKTRDNADPQTGRNP